MTSEEAFAQLKEQIGNLEALPLSSLAMVLELVSSVMAEHVGAGRAGWKYVLLGFVTSQLANDDGHRHAVSCMLEALRSLDCDCEWCRAGADFMTGKTDGSA